MIPNTRRVHAWCKGCLGDAHQNVRAKFFERDLKLGAELYAVKLQDECEDVTIFLQRLDSLVADVVGMRRE